MRLNKTTNHAIRILCACAQAGDDLKKAADLADALDLTQQNTVKIIHGLIRSGFLQSTRGRNGGVRLALPADEIYVGAVVRETEAGLADAHAVDTNSGDGFNILVDDAFAAFLDVLDGQTLTDLMTSPSKPKSKTQTKSTRQATSVAAHKNPKKSRALGVAGTRS